MSQKSVANSMASSSWQTETLSSTVFPITNEFQYEWLEGSTQESDRLEEIRHNTKALFEAAKDQHFEDGMESEFSNKLVCLIEKHSHVALAAMAHLIISEMVNDEVASEALRWLGRMDHPPTYHARLQLLERSLFSPSARVRDGAALGLASMDDPHAITYLKQAIQKETLTELSRDLQQVLMQLEILR